MRPAHGRFAGLLFVALVGTGCERMRDVKRCRALAENVNGALDAVEREAARGAKDVSYEQIANQYEGLAKSIEGFDGGTPELGRAVSEYASLARNAARQATALRGAREAGNKVSADLATRELDRIARHEKTLVARIDEECRPK